MLTIPRYRGLELPVYETDVALTHPRRIADTNPVETFMEETALRVVKASITGDSPRSPESLEELLRVTDEELSSVASACRARVIGHQWGLVYDPKNERYGDDHKRRLYGNLYTLMPKDHFLVAEVDILRNVVTMSLSST